MGKRASTKADGYVLEIVYQDREFVKKVMMELYEVRELVTLRSTTRYIKIIANKVEDLISAIDIIENCEIEEQERINKWLK